MVLTVHTRAGSSEATGADDLVRTLDPAGFSWVVASDLASAHHAIPGLPRLRLLDRLTLLPDYAIRLDPDLVETVIPVVDGYECHPMYVAATHDRVLVVGAGAHGLAAAALERFPWDAERPGAVATFLLAEVTMRAYRTATREFRAALDALEDEMMSGVLPEQLEELSRIQRRTGTLRRHLAEYADATADYGAEAVTSLGLPPEAARLAVAHWSDVDAMVVRLGGVREEAAHVMDLYQSLNATRQNEVITRLTIISALLLPLTFVTGFYGMNFGWLVERIESPASFLVLGVLLPAAVAASLLLVMARAGWFRLTGRRSRPRAGSDPGR